MIESFPNILPSVLVLATLSILPFIVVTATSFTKISIVLMLLRNALGVQQAPSSLVLNSIALMLTLFISFPIIVKVGEQIGNLDFNNISLFKSDLDLVFNTIAVHIDKNVAEEEKAFFMSAAENLWPQDLHKYIQADSIFILLPSHIVSELSRAFQIGFLLFLPFVIIDLVVSNILLAMGAMMVPPMLISLPIKILLFVAADGWAKLLHSLTLTYMQ